MNGNHLTSLSRLESDLWEAADQLRANSKLTSTEYCMPVLGLIFLRHATNRFNQATKQIEADMACGKMPKRSPVKADYLKRSALFLPEKARYDQLLALPGDTELGQALIDAMTAIEESFEPLAGILPKDYSIFERTVLEDLLRIFDREALHSAEGDVFGRIYEYFLMKFAMQGAQDSGEFFTPPSLVQTIVNVIEPDHGVVFDPACGSGGMFVQAKRFIQSHTSNNGNGNGKHSSTRRDISIYGQESNYTTWRLAKMNLAIRGIDANIAHGDTFHADGNPDLKADFVLANPPFNDSDWNGELLKDDKRWQYGMPPAGNANYAWVQHFISHLAPTGTAGFVLANGSMSSSQKGEGAIRQRIVEADLVDCMVALPGQLFYSTQIPVCLWFLSRDKRNNRFRDRRGEILFIDARKMGSMADRTHRELTAEDIAKIADTYHAWRLDPDVDAEYEDVPGFCKSTKVEEVAEHGFVLTPGRYVGAPPAEEDAEPFDDKMKRLTAELAEQMAEGQRLEAEIRKNLESIGYGC